MQRRIISAALIILAVVFVVTFVAGLVIGAYGHECDADEQCLGDGSTCVLGRCACDVQYFGYVVRCDPSLVHEINALHILHLISLMLMVICCAAYPFSRE